jgi:hypothetical protein
MVTQTSWRMRGDVMEACSCATTCPCNFGSDPTPLPCEVVIGWRIEEGQLTSPLVVEFSGGPAVCCGVVEVVIGPVG